MSLNHITDESYPFPIPAWFYQINADEGGIVTDGLVDKKHPIETWLGTSPTGVAHWALCDTSGNYLSSIGMTGTNLIVQDWSSGSVTNTPISLNRSNGNLMFSGTVAVNGLTPSSSIGVNNNLLTTSAAGSSTGPGVTFFADNTSGMYYDSNGVIVGIASAGSSRISTNATGTIISNPLTLSTLTDNTHGNVSSGTYTPTIANLAGVNVGNSTALPHYYIRIGNKVFVSGICTIGSGLMSTTQFDFSITLPFAMSGNFNSVQLATGSGSCYEVALDSNTCAVNCRAVNGFQLLDVFLPDFAIAPATTANNIWVGYTIAYSVV